MKHLIIILYVLTLGVSSLAQSDNDLVLEEVERNNKSLSALRQWIEAEKVLNKTGLTPDNPEFGFNYLWGDPSNIGNRKDISITQSFDFPTVYGQRNKISELKNDQLETEYEYLKRTIRLKVRNLLIDLWYYNSIIDEYTVREEHAIRIADSNNAGFIAGEISVLDLNKARINLLNIQKELELMEIEKSSILMELSGLNGGKALVTGRIEYSNPLIPDDFELWYEKLETENPYLIRMDLESQKSIQEVKLIKGESLPKFSAGYMSEEVSGEKFQGLSIGLSIPLWENKNKIKYARENIQSVERMKEDKKTSFYTYQKKLHEKAVTLQKNTRDYRKVLMELDHTELLMKALETGEISLIEYLMELSVYYEGMNRLFDYERELAKVIAEMVEGV